LTERADPAIKQRGPDGERGARVYSGGLGSGSGAPAGSRGIARGQGSGGQSPLKLKAFYIFYAGGRRKFRTFWGIYE